MTPDLLKILETKSCAGCTKCCEGYLSAVIKGHEMGPNKPCIFVEKNVGCKEYDSRPYEPCVTFQCEWRRNPHFEEWLSPVNSSAVFTRQSLDGIPYLKLIEAGATLDAQVLSWAILYCMNNNINFMWDVNDKVHFIGSAEFTSLVTAKQS